MSVQTKQNQKNANRRGKKAERQGKKQAISAALAALQDERVQEDYPEPEKNYSNPE